ncbi:MAG: ATP-grasp domain-containing protein [Spirochaetia bacterium]
MKVGILEFPDNSFIRGVASRLDDLAPQFIRQGELVHPQPSPYRVIIDRVSFCDPYLRTIVRYWSRAGAYVINNPFFTHTTDKLSELLLYDSLGIRYPRTVVLPRINRVEDVKELVAQPDWKVVEERVGFPCILKPVDGYGWQDVFRVETPLALRSLYESLSDSRVLMAQELVEHVDYLRAFCVESRDVFLVRWTPRPFDMAEYSLLGPDDLKDIRDEVTAKTAALTEAQGLDFNTVEWSVTKDRTPVVIDSYNDVPDVRPEKLPAPCYEWVLDRFCACVRSKLASNQTNAVMGPRGFSGPAADPG